MNVIDQLASSQGRKDEKLNIQLAQRIAESNDLGAVKELIQILDRKNKSLQSDSIKVFYELGELNPNLIKPYLNHFVDKLKSKNNRLMWGAMAAIDKITGVEPGGVYFHLAQIMEAADQGSVITKDGAVNILIQLSQDNLYAGSTIPLLLEMLQKAAINQLPMYAERSYDILSRHGKQSFRRVLKERVSEDMKESKRRRLKKILSHL